MNLQLGLEPIDTKPDPEDQTLWSVTTIIGALDKPALMYWAAEQTAKAAVASHRSIGARIAEEGEEPVVKWLRDARFRRPKDRLTAANLGTVAHSAAEEYALTGIRPDKDRLAYWVNEKAGNGFIGTDHEVGVLTQMLDRFDGWLQRFTPEYQATEVTVYHPDYAYGGTCDGFLTIDGVRFLIDYKSTRDPRDSRGKPKTPYPEQVGLQIAAYRYAKYAAVWRPRRTEKWRRRYYLLSPEEQAAAVPVPEVDGGLVIQMTTESCEAFPIRADEQAFRAFLHTLEAFRWVNEISKTAMGDPLERTTT